MFAPRAALQPLTLRMNVPLFAAVDWFVSGAFIAYLLLMLAIGFFFSSKTATMDEYYLGGRKMNKWVVALSAQASDMSGWLLMGLPGAIYLSGFSEAWIGIGLGIGTYLNWKIVAHRLRQYSRACKDSITIPDFIANRFRDSLGVSRLIAALITLVFFTFYTASGFVSCAKLFSEIFSLDYTWALWIGAFVVISYTLMGGYNAVCWTDFVQGSLMFIAIVAVPTVILFQAGGFSATVTALNEATPEAPNTLLNLFTNASTGQSIGLIGLCSSLAWGLGYFGMPHILVRFMSIDNPAEVKGSRRIAMTWVFISLGCAVAIGLFGHIFLPHYGLPAYTDANGAERVFLSMIGTIFSGNWFLSILAGIFFSAVLAAIMSTADSQLLVSASAFSNDIYKVALRRNAKEKELVLVSRLTVAAVAIVSIILAMNEESDFFKVIMKMVSFAWGGFGASFGPVILLALFWRRTNLAGAISGMVVGAVTCFVWKFVLAANFAECCPIFGLYELAPGFVLSFLTIVIVSLLTKAPSKEITDEFDFVSQLDDRAEDAAKAVTESLQANH